MRTSRQRRSWFVPCAATACALLLLAGCAVLPEPTREEIRSGALERVLVPPNWSAEASAARIDGDWLASFADPALSRVVHEALANNPDLRMAAARLEQADAQVEIAQAQLRPAIGLLGRAGSKPVTDLSPLLSGVMLRLSWEVDLWGRLRYARNAAAAMRDASDAEYRFAQQSLAAAVARAWFVVGETRQQSELAGRMVESSRTLLRLAEQRRRVGADGEGDVTSARADLNANEDAQLRIGLAHRQAVRALELLLGRYPGGALVESATLAVFPGAVPAGIPMDVLDRRLDMLAAERRIAATFDRVGEAKAAMLPALSLSAGYGRLSDDAVRMRGDLEQRISSVTGTVSAPLYTGGALTGQVALRTAEQREAVVDYARRALVAFGEVESALDSERVLAERERILEDAAIANKRSAELEDAAYRVGKSDLRAVNRRLLATHAAELAVIAVRRERLARRIDLHLALGGGFGEPPPAVIDAQRDE